MEAPYALLGTAARTVEWRTRALEPERDQVLVRVLACGVCRGDLLDFARDRAQPAAFGHEAVGRVVECGPWVTGLRVGDWVVGGLDGGFSAAALGRERDLYRVAPELGDLAALAEPLKCVTTVVRAAAPDLGDSVAVVGCGFMGLAAIAFLAGGWPAQVIAVEPDAERRALAAELGATHAVDPSARDAVAAVRELTGGRGVAAAIDFAGSEEVTTLAARLLATRGRLVAAAGYLPRDRDLELYLRALTIHAAPPAFSPDPGADWRHALAALQSGHFPVERLLTHRFPLSDLQAALETALQGASVGYLKGLAVNDLPA